MSAIPGPTPAAPGIERVTLRDPGELVTVLPHLLGYTPSTGDIVLVAFCHNRVLASATFSATDAVTSSCTNDRAGAGSGDAGRVWAGFLHGVTGPGRSPGRPDAVYCVAYASPAADQFTAGLLALAPPLLADAIRVHEGRWRSLTCTTRGCCPPVSVPVPGERPELIAPFVAGGSRPLPGRHHLRQVMEPGPAELITVVAAHLDTLTPLPAARGHHPGGAGSDPAGNRRCRPGSGHTPSCVEGIALLASAYQAFADGPAGLSPVQAASLLDALDDVNVRDQCLAWAGDQAWWLWTALIRYAPPGWVAPVATLIAATAYQQGNGALARIAAEHALDDHPRYSMARLLLDLLTAGVHPADFTASITHALASIDTTTGPAHT